MDIRELYDFQESTARSFRKSIRSISEQYKLSKLTEKHIEAITSNLEMYEIMHDTLIKVRETISTINKSDNQETVEKELKFLYDSFWE